MMVQIAENWSDIEGVITTIGNLEKPSGFIPVSLAVTVVKEVEGFLSMIKVEERNIEIHFPLELARSLKLTPGQRFAARVRRGGPENIFFIHRDYLRLLD